MIPNPLHKNNDAGASCMLAIASGKGGTGKSFLATNLAVLLSQQERSVTLVDCDFGLANDHLLLGVNPKLTAQHVFAGQATMSEVCTKTPFGPNLVPGGSGISQLGSLDERELWQFARNLHDLAVRDEVLVLDAAAGITPQGILILLAAQQVVIVTNPEIAALTDAYALIKCLARQPGCPLLYIVVNRVRVRGQGEATFEKLANVSRRFAECDIHYLGEVPEDASVTQLRLTQAPIVVSRPQCKVSKAIRTILHRLQEEHGLMQPPAVGRDQLEHRLGRYLTPENGFSTWSGRG